MGEVSETPSSPHRVRGPISDGVLGSTLHSTQYGVSHPGRRPWATKLWSSSSPPARAARSGCCSDWSLGTGHPSRPARVRPRLLLEPTQRDCPGRGCRGSPAPTTPRVVLVLRPRRGAQPTLPRENSSLCCSSGQLLITSGSSISSQSTRSPEQGPSCTASRLKGKQGRLSNGQPGAHTDRPQPRRLTCSHRLPGPLGLGAPSLAAAGSSPRRRAAGSGTRGQWRRARPTAPPGEATPPQSDPGGLWGQGCWVAPVWWTDRQAPDHLTPGQTTPGPCKTTKAPACPGQGSRR